MLRGSGNLVPMSDVADRIAEIYGGPLDEFVSARDALSRELRQAGDRDGAAEVKALRKPRALAWALDAAVVAAPDALAGLVAAVDEAGQAQAGGGDVRAALASLREAEAQVVAAAVEAAAAQGQRLEPSAAGGALRAVIADPEALADLQAGRLVDTPATGGLGVAFSGGGTSAPAKAAPAKTRSQAKAAPPRKAPAASRAKPEPEAPQVDPAALTAARRAVGAAERALRTATNTARRAASTADEVEERAAAARRRADDAAEAERSAEATLAHAQEALAALEGQSSRR
jgi:hypothetical protein